MINKWLTTHCSYELVDKMTLQEIWNRSEMPKSYTSHGGCIALCGPAVGVWQQLRNFEATLQVRKWLWPSGGASKIGCSKVLSQTDGVSACFSMFQHVSACFSMFQHTCESMIGMIGFLVPRWAKNYPAMFMTGTGTRPCSA